MTVARQRANRVVELLAARRVGHDGRYQGSGPSSPPSEPERGDPDRVAAHHLRLHVLTQRRDRLLHSFTTARWNPTTPRRSTHRLWAPWGCPSASTTKKSRSAIIPPALRRVRTRRRRRGRPRDHRRPPRSRGNHPPERVGRARVDRVVVLCSRLARARVGAGCGGDQCAGDERGRDHREHQQRPASQPDDDHDGPQQTNTGFSAASRTPVSPSPTPRETESSTRLPSRCHPSTARSRRA